MLDIKGVPGGGIVGSRGSAKAPEGGLGPPLERERCRERERDVAVVVVVVVVVDVVVVVVAVDVVGGAVCVVVVVEPPVSNASKACRILLNI